MTGPEAERLRRLNNRPERAGGAFVLYWMQQAQRVAFNHALEHAVREANARALPVVAGFGLAAYPEANLRAYAFLLEGLVEVRDTLEARGIPFVLRLGEPPETLAELAGQAALAVTDRGYLKPQVAWRRRAAVQWDVALVEVESDVIVPVDVVSDHEEFAARTLRPKIHRLLDGWLVPVATADAPRPARGLRLEGEAVEVDALLRKLKVDRSVPRSDRFHGGAREARRLLDAFVARKLTGYAKQRGDPNLDHASHLSPYLHFGQISPLEIALAARRARTAAEDRDAFLEELIVRRELSMNFVRRNADYDRYEGLPAWARHTLAIHAEDPRAYRYDRAAWEAAATHDPFWNAAQRELAVTGKMHNYMRMYWGKKILEWSASPEEAFETALYLNNKYALDGRDANSYAGVAWCFGKHDRPWTGRPVFGLVRYMNDKGLTRKFDMNGYLAAWPA